MPDESALMWPGREEREVVRFALKRALMTEMLRCGSTASNFLKMLVDANVFMRDCFFWIVCVCICLFASLGKLLSAIPLFKQAS